MFTRTQPAEVPERERMDLETALCPPHDFDAAWASPALPSTSDDTVPALYCKCCGEVRAFRIPSAD